MSTPPPAPLRPEVRAWIERTRPQATVVPLAGDASARQFVRLQVPGRDSRVLMIYAAPFEGETDDVRLERIFREAGLPVAAIHEVVPDPGLLVLEDLGDRQLEAAVREDPGVAMRWLEQGVDLAARVRESGTPVLARSARREGPALDPERFRFEMDYFVQHFGGALLGREAEASRCRPLLHRLADRAASSSARVLCHRDFHSRNLMVRKDRTLAMVDIQDARWGPDTYDLASLLFDAYIDIDPDQVEPLVERFRASLPAPPPAEELRERLTTVATQRLIKALGTFGYQVAVLGRERYREPIPRTLRRLRDLLPRLENDPELGRALESAGLLDGDGSS